MNGHPDLWRADPDLSFDAVVELASRMRLTCSFDDPPLFRRCLLHNESQVGRVFYIAGHICCGYHHRIGFSGGDRFTAPAAATAQAQDRTQQ